MARRPGQPVHTPPMLIPRQLRSRDLQDLLDVQTTLTTDLEQGTDPRPTDSPVRPGTPTRGQEGIPGPAAGSGPPPAAAEPPSGSAVRPAGPTDRSAAPTDAAITSTDPVTAPQRSPVPVVASAATLARTRFRASAPQPAPPTCATSAPLTLLPAVHQPRSEQPDDRLLVEGPAWTTAEPVSVTHRPRTTGWTGTGFTGPAEQRLSVDVVQGRGPRNRRRRTHDHSRRLAGHNQYAQFTARWGVARTDADAGTPDDTVTPAPHTPAPAVPVPAVSAAAVSAVSAAPGAGPLVAEPPIADAPAASVASVASVASPAPPPATRPAEPTPAAPLRVADLPIPPSPVPASPTAPVPPTRPTAHPTTSPTAPAERVMRAGWPPPGVAHRRGGSGSRRGVHRHRGGDRCAAERLGLRRPIGNPAAGPDDDRRGHDHPDGRTSRRPRCHRPSCRRPCRADLCPWHHTCHRRCRRTDTHRTDLDGHTTDPGRRAAADPGHPPAVGRSTAEAGRDCHGGVRWSTADRLAAAEHGAPPLSSRSPPRRSIGGRTPSKIIFHERWRCRSRAVTSRWPTGHLP